MSLKRQFAPGEVKILRALIGVGAEREIFKSYTTLREETSLSDPVLSSYLKRLRKRGLLNRDIDTRKYSLSVNGRRRLELFELTEKIRKIIEEEETLPVRYKSEELKRVKLASASKKNLRMLANCTLELHKAFLQLPKVKKLYGSNPYIRVVEQDDREIVLYFKRYVEERK